MKAELASMAALFLVATLIPPSTNAATLETFTFTQTGYPPGGTLTGTLTGAVEVDGSIQQADLTAFSASLVDDLGPLLGTQIDHYSLGNLQLFSLIPSMDGPNSSLDIFASVTSGPPGSICVGAAAAFGLCGQGGNFSGVDHVRYQPNPFLWVTTTQTAVVQLMSAQPTAAPEPASIGLCGLALVSTIVWRYREAARGGRSSLGQIWMRHWNRHTSDSPGRLVGKPWVDGRADVELAGEHWAFLVKSFGSKTNETS